MFSIFRGFVASSIEEISWPSLSFHVKVHDIAISQLHVIEAGVGIDGHELKI